MEINAQFRDRELSPTDFAAVLNRLGKIVDWIAGKHDELDKGGWSLKRNSREEAGLYQVFDDDQPSSVALAVLKEQFRNSTDQTFVSIWDGNESSTSGVSMTCHIGPQGELDLFAVEIVGEQGVEDFETIVGIVIRAVQEFSPAYVEVSPREYFEKQVFDDKPGVGWMLYLPKVIRVEEVPEARALIPVPEAGNKQAGTIIVSVADAVFSVDNPEHVEIANRIEIRLVDQDLLPRYVDL